MGSEMCIRDRGRPITIEQDQARLRPTTSEVFRLYGDNTLARELLGWEPQVDLDAGLAETIDWIKAHLDQYNPTTYQV